MARHAAIAIDTRDVRRPAAIEHRANLAYETTSKAVPRIDLRDKETRDHAPRGGDVAASGPRARDERGGARARAPRRAPARHRQDGRPRPHPPQARQALGGRVGDHEAPSRLRLRAALADLVPAGGARHPLLSPRKVGWEWLPARSEGRGDSFAARSFAVVDIWTRCGPIGPTAPWPAVEKARDTSARSPALTSIRSWPRCSWRRSWRPTKPRAWRADAQRVAAVVTLDGVPSAPPVEVLPQRCGRTCPPSARGSRPPRPAEALPS